MKESMSRMLVETVVKRALNSIKESPERGIRNLVDMALQFSEGRFQKNFFAATQTLLQNENSAYYSLVRDAVTYTDMNRLYTFGMNLGYNSCTEGARRIRRNENEMHCRIPWTLFLQINATGFDERLDMYNTLIQEGERLGIYTWMIGAMDDPQKALSLAKSHPDSAFCIFCEYEKITAAFLDDAAEIYNIMPVIRYEESAADLYANLRKTGMLYSVWYPYGQNDIEIILNGDLFNSTQQLSPIFTVLIPEPFCPENVCRLVYQTVKNARDDQTYRTLIWELPSDNQLIDSIISGDTCSIGFDQNGELLHCSNDHEYEHHNLYQSSLSDILISSCPK